MALIVYELAIESITLLGPVIRQIARRDRALAGQMKRSASSIALNIAEGARSRGGNEIARFQDAAGSANETRAALQVAVAWQYIAEESRLPIEQKLDRVCAMLWALVHKPKRFK